MPAQLVDSTPVCYLGNDMNLVWRPCRIWRTATDEVLAVVTETSEPTMSIETAAVEIRMTLETFWAPDQVKLVEHWPEKTGADPAEHYAEQFQREGRIVWRHVSASELREQLANFEETKPSSDPLLLPSHNARQ
ncbi:hypothetical protein [Streptomyces sp. NPDC058268]|uniref:hypothetical protein n=1 Tax=Streptomyces sp. NPDC058268 TaxID=3346413 RepID=UPI0036E16267